MNIDQSDRIATLQEWLATDAKIIQQLKESNNLLSQKVAQLEKEKHELTQKLETAIDHIEPVASYCGSSACFVCNPESPANRKD